MLLFLPSICFYVRTPKQMKWQRFLSPFFSFQQKYQFPPFALLPPFRVFFAKGPVYFCEAKLNGDSVRVLFICLCSVDSTSSRPLSFHISFPSPFLWTMHSDIVPRPHPIADEGIHYCPSTTSSPHTRRFRIVDFVF